MVIFNSYVKLPEGKDQIGHLQISQNWQRTLFFNVFDTYLGYV